MYQEMVYTNSVQMAVQVTSILGTLTVIRVQIDLQDLHFFFAG